MKNKGLCDRPDLGRHRFAWDAAFDPGSTLATCEAGDQETAPENTASAEGRQERPSRPWSKSV